jgi:hypothetical protein
MTRKTNIEARVELATNNIRLLKKRRVRIAATVKEITSVLEGTEDPTTEMLEEAKALLVKYARRLGKAKAKNQKILDENAADI